MSVQRSNNEDHRPFNELCPIWRAANIIGDPCALMIIRDLLKDDACKYSDFNARDRGFSLNTLSKRLKDLQAADIIKSEPYQQNPIRHQYKLTARGKKLGPVVAAMYKWGDTHAL